jgi:RNA polymerase sigma factor for flagellar operon FliA
MLDELRHVDPVPRLMRSRANRLRKAHLKLERQHGRAPRDIEVAREMGLPLGDLDALYREVRVALPAELHRRPLEKDETLLGLELLEDAGAEDPLRQSGDNELIRFCLGKLTRRDAFVFVLYFLEERTLKEIGWILGLSESRVCQLQARISVRLQGKLKPRTVVA